MGDLGEEPTPFAGIGFLKRRLDRGHPKVAGLWIDILEDGVASVFFRVAVAFLVFYSRDGKMNEATS
jgi:hypothetical protein